MQLLLPLIAIGVLIVISLNIPKATPTLKPSPSPTTTPTPTPIKSGSTSSYKSTITIVVTPTPTKPSETSSSSDFIYPNSKIILNTNGKISLESNDSPNEITNWYKARIKEKGMSATSFITTSTNGKVLNKLSGAGNNQKVEVEIQKESDSNIVRIDVSF